MRFSNEIIKGLTEKCFVYSLFGSRKGNVLKSLLELIKNFICLTNKVDVIHFVVMSPYNIPFMLLAKIYRKPVVSTYHGIYTSEISFIGNTFRFISHLFADYLTRACSDVIVSPTQYLCSRLRIKNKVVIIPNPLNVDEVYRKSLGANRIKDDKLMFVTASNFNIPQKFKSIQLLLKAIKEVSVGVEFNLLIFGTGSHLDEFRRQTSKEDNIEYMGYRDDMVSFLKRSTAYLHISGLDNQPYSVIEAMALGRVVMCSDIGGLMETVERENNFVVSLDKRSITEGLRNMLSEIKNEYETFENRGKKNRCFAIKKYATEVVSSQYLEIYGKVANEI